MPVVLRRSPSSVLRWLATLAALAVLLRAALSAYGGKALLWAFQPMLQSRFTAMAMLTGTLQLREGIRHAWVDEQIHDGATYTNWGFGVPLLQMPFHWIAFHLPSHFPSRFFPDRAIYAFYFAAMVPLLWAGFDHMLASRGVASRLRRRPLSWAATLLALTCVLFPLMSCRWWIYEETIAYFVVFELVALAAYLLAAPSWRPGAVAGLGAAAGMALFIRPTGLLYVGVWAALVLLGSRSKSAVAWFSAGVAPLLGLWMWANTVRTGGPFHLGFNNTTPFLSFQLPMVRFGSTCVDSRVHFFEAARRLFRAFFVLQPTTATDWMKACHFDFEVRPPETAAYARDAFFGPAILLLLGWILASYIVRRERRLAPYVPFAAFVALFLAFTLAGAGFVWRYTGDFWPLVVLIVAAYVRQLPTGANRWIGARLAALLTGASALVYARDVKPALATIEVAKDADVAGMWEHFQTVRYEMDPALQSSFTCGSGPGPSWPINNGAGWSSPAFHDKGCEVLPYTNIYLGIPEGGGHRLRFDVDHATPAPLEVYVNGRTYETRTEGDSYVVDVNLDRAKFKSPIVLVTIEWTRKADAPGIKLLSVALD